MIQEYTEKEIEQLESEYYYSQIINLENENYE